MTNAIGWPRHLRRNAIVVHALGAGYGPLDAAARQDRPVTGKQISLTVTPQGVVAVHPVGAVMSIVVPTGSGPIRSTFCCTSCSSRCPTPAAPGS